jgi:hypothetical protein
LLQNRHLGLEPLERLGLKAAAQFAQDESQPRGLARLELAAAGLPLVPASWMTGESRITAACAKKPMAATIRQASAPKNPPIKAPKPAPIGRAP